MRLFNVTAATVGLLLASGLGCAGMGGSEKKSEAMAAQDQAQSQYQHAADAQKQARDEQAKAEQDNRDVAKKQRELADAQARARGQEQKAQQSQADAARSGQAAQQAGAEQQADAQRLQKRGIDEQAQLQQQRQGWSKTQELSGKLLGASEGNLQVRGDDQKVMQLKVNESTAILQDGRLVPAAQLTPGIDVRASYQLVDGKATALRIEATSNNGSGTNPTMPAPAAPDQGQQQQLNGQPSGDQQPK